MSRLTGSDAKGLMEAYQAVYAPQQELTEEHVWEEVENWVNSLLEEGYDLSNYTWDEMYENYLTEIDLNQLNPLNLIPGMDPESNKARYAKAIQNQNQQKANRATNQRADLGVVRTSTGYIVKPGTNTYDQEKYSQGLKLAQRLNTETGLGKTPITAPVAPVAAKPVAGAPPKPAARPTTSATAKPAVTPATKPAAPATGMLGKTKFEVRTPTSAELRAAQAARSGGATPEAALQAAQKTNLPTTGPTPAIPNQADVAASTGSFTRRDMNKYPLKPITSSFDMFDVVLSHLLDEGYADTEKQAAAMIPHLGESWISNIIGNIIINEHFTDCVNSMIDNGYDLSQYSVEDLFEEYSVHLIDVVSEQYGCSDKQLDLHEIVPLIAAGAATAPAWMPAAAAGLAGATALYALNKKKIDDAAGRAVQSASDFVMQARNRNKNRTPTGTSTNINANQIRGNTGSGNAGGGGSGGSGGGGGGDKKPPIDTFRTLKDVGKLFGKAKDKIGQAFDQTLGKPARARILGGTRPGQLTRAGGIAIGSAADLIPKIAGSDKPSNLAKLGSFGPGVLGNLANLASEIPGVKGSSTEDGLKGAGSFLKSQGQGMWDQGAASQTPNSPPPREGALPTAPVINWNRPAKYDKK